MRRNRKHTLLLSLLLATGIAACVSQATTLNSERIARKFGSYGIEVIEKKDNIRVSNLYSQEAVGTVCRTFAVVRLTERPDSAIAEAHAIIAAGGSIGAVFKERGWTIAKRHRYLGEIAIIEGRSARITRLMRIQPPAVLAVHVYDLTVRRNGVSFDYATIAELHHPDYLSHSDLVSLFGSDHSSDQNRDEVGKLLALVRGSITGPET